MRTISLLTLLLLGSSAGCVAISEPSEADWETKGADAIKDGDYANAIQMVILKARKGDPEYQFTVGQLQLEWLEDPNPKEPPRHSAADALVWIYKAVKAGVPQAASTLRDGYEWGRYSLPKSAELEACWRKVEIGEQAAVICLEAEAKLQHD